MSTDDDQKMTSADSVVEQQKNQALKKVLSDIRDNIGQALSLLDSGQDVPVEKLKELLGSGNKLSDKTEPAEAANVVEGVFDGQQMIGSDGKQYTVPANYASKSKLVEGDILKLTIAKNGSFIYKQISPIVRERVIGTIVKDEDTSSFFVVNDERKWRVLTASVTYFNGDTGDEAVILVPKEGKSKWAAIENVIKQ
ncbi:MAG: hypothetical protein WCW02_00840 [Candidatus Buchananbacteria bacterium]